MTNIVSKVQLYPNGQQAEAIKANIGCARFIYNQMLSERIEVYAKLKDDKDSLFAYKYKTEKQYKEEFHFLKNASSQCLQQSRINLEQAYQNFYRRLRKGRTGGFPQFKKRSKAKWSYREPRLKIRGNKIQLTKLGWVKSRGLNVLANSIAKSATIELGRDGKFYAFILFETKQKIRHRISDNAIGADLGLKDFVTLSTGEIINGVHKYLKKINGQIDKANKHLSRKKYRSNRYQKQRIKLARLYKKRNNIQDHFFWHLANKLCSENQAIAIEKLNVSGMKKNRRLSKSIHYVSWSSFITKLKQKAVEYQTVIHEADRFFPSSKLCPSCGNIKQDLTLADRIYYCECGYTQHRDINAAINLRNEYSAKYVENRRGESIRPRIINFDLKGRFVETSTDEAKQCA